MFRSYFGHYLGYIRFVPVLILICLNTWSYYAFIFCYLTELDFTGTFNLVSTFLLYHLFFFMFIWCFFKTLKSKVNKPPNQFYVTRSRDQLLKDCSLNDDKNKILKNISLNLPVVMRSYGGGIRYCNKCTCLKPDRAHHCSVCGMCVLKMDHHCPWVNNCIGFSNYKFFLLFLFYALLYCSFLSLVLTSSMSTFTDQVEDNRGGAITHVFMLWILSSLLIIGLTVLLLLHSFLLLTNRTTLELFQTPLFSCGPIKRAYDRGWRENFLQVFGHKKKYWLVPISSSIGDGINYPMADILQSIVGKQLLALKERLAEEGMN